MKPIVLVLLLTMAAVSHAQITADPGSIPADWTRLTKMDSENKVYTTCDGGNLRLRLFEESGKWYILAYGQQEDYLLEVRKASGNKKIIFDCVWNGTDEKQQFAFSWIDKAKGLAYWEAKGWDWDYTFVSLDNEPDYLHEAQPCTACFDEEGCDGLEDYYDPVDRIRAIFSNYVHYEEGIDSDEGKAEISKALDELKGKELSQNDLVLLVNVWMYYDPTDFGDAMTKSRELLIAHGDESLKAIRYRQAHKREWEDNGTAPYADLPRLLKEIEDKK